MSDEWIIAYMSAGPEDIINALEAKGIPAYSKNYKYARFQASDIGCHNSSGKSAPAVTVGEEAGKLKVGCFTCGTSVLDKIHDILGWKPDSSSNRSYADVKKWVVEVNKPLPTPDDIVENDTTEIVKPDPTTAPMITMGDLRRLHRWIITEAKTPASKWPHPYLLFKVDTKNRKREPRESSPQSEPVPKTWRQSTNEVGSFDVTAKTPDSWITYEEAIDVCNAATEHSPMPAFVHSGKGEKVDGLSLFLDCDFKGDSPQEVEWADALLDSLRQLGLKFSNSQSGLGKHSIVRLHPDDYDAWDKLFTGNYRQFGPIMPEVQCERKHTHNSTTCHISTDTKLEMWNPRGDGRYQCTLLDEYDDHVVIDDADELPILYFSDFIGIGGITSCMTAVGNDGDALRVLTRDSNGVKILLTDLGIEIRRNKRTKENQLRHKNWNIPNDADAIRFYRTNSEKVPVEGWAAISQDVVSYIENHGRLYYYYKISPLGDADSNNLRAYELTSKQYRDAITELALDHQTDEVIEWLESMPDWDQTSRIDTWLTELLGVKDTPENRLFQRKCIIAYLCRILEPGCLVDWLPILVGPQGVGKSEAVKGLVPSNKRIGTDAAHSDAWFSDSISFNQPIRERLFSIGTAVVCELSEMTGADTASHNREIKSFVSRQAFTGRMPYATEKITLPFAFVLWGTANDDGRGVIPSDASGNRRFVILECCKVPSICMPDVSDMTNKNPAGVRAWMVANLEQLLVEGMLLRQQGEDQFLPSELHREMHDRGRQWETEQNEVLVSNLESLAQEPLAYLQNLTAIRRFDEDSIPPVWNDAMGILSDPVCGIADLGFVKIGTLADWVDANATRGLKSVLMREGWIVNEKSVRGKIYRDKSGKLGAVQAKDSVWAYKGKIETLDDDDLPPAPAQKTQKSKKKW